MKKLNKVILFLKKAIFEHEEDEISSENLINDFKNTLSHIYRKFHRYSNIDRFKKKLTDRSKV